MCDADVQRIRDRWDEVRRNAFVNAIDKVAKTGSIPPDSPGKTGLRMRTRSVSQHSIDPCCNTVVKQKFFVVHLSHATLHFSLPH
jgi:hypothetical protein